MGGHEEADWLAEIGKGIEEPVAPPRRGRLRRRLLAAFLLLGAGFLAWGVFLYNPYPADRVFAQKNLNRMLKEAVRDVEREMGKKFLRRPTIRTASLGEAGDRPVCSLSVSVDTHRWRSPGYDLYSHVSCGGCREAQRTPVLYVPESHEILVVPDVVRDFVSNLHFRQNLEGLVRAVVLQETAFALTRCSYELGMLEDESLTEDECYMWKRLVCEYARDVAHRVYLKRLRRRGGKKMYRGLDACVSLRRGSDFFEKLREKGFRDGLQKVLDDPPTDGYEVSYAEVYFNRLQID